MAGDIIDPRVLVGCAVYLEDNRYYGTVSDITLPDLSFLDVETGTAIKRKQVVPVLQAMTAKLKVHGDNKPMVEAFARQVGDSMKVFIRNDVVRARHDSLEVTLGGNGKTLSNPHAQPGEKLETSIDINVDVYVYQVNGTKYYEIDAKKIICMLDGKDILAETRANL